MTGPELEGALRAYFQERFPHRNVVVISLSSLGGTLDVVQNGGWDGVFSASWHLEYGETMADAVQRIKEQL